MGIHHCSPEICKVCNRPKQEAVNKPMRLGNILNHVSIPDNYIKLDNCIMGSTKQVSKDILSV